MAWQPTKPLAADQLSNSQSDLQGNFTELDTWSKVNHEPINSGTPATSGMHKYLTLTRQGAPNPPLDAGTNTNLWNDSVTGELFLKSVTTGSFPLTAKNAAFTDGFTYLPSGFSLRWKRTFLNIGDTTINFNGVGFPVWVSVINAWAISFPGSNIDANRAYNIITYANPASVTIKTVLRDSSLADPGDDNAIVYALGRDI